MQENNENITFHDEEVPENKKMSKKTIIALIFLAVFVIVSIIDISSLFVGGSELAKESFKAGFNAGLNATEENLSSGISDSFTPMSLLISAVKFISFLGSVIFGAMALKETKKNNLPKKGLAVLAIIGPFAVMVINFIITVVFAASLIKETGVLSSFHCIDATRCVDNGNGTSTCVYNAEEISCENSLLSEDQYE